MPKYKMLVEAGGSSDAGILDRLAAAAKARGFDAISMASLAEHTADQIGDGSDSWVRFTAGCPGLMKVVETSLVHGVLSKKHIEKNAALLIEQSAVLAKRGLKGAVAFLEPMWLPKSWYREHPDLRGARCDNPCLALDRYYAPCIDRGEVLAHYREAVRKLLELAPEIGLMSIFTNDSGGGICWCTGLYPGRNGPDYCKDIPFGGRIAKWLEAMLQGAADAGKEIEVAIMPVHFSRDEKYDTLARLPKHAHLSLGRDNFPNIPFFSPESLDLFGASSKRRRGAMVSVNPTLVSWLMEPVTQMPVPYYMFDAWREVGNVSADILAVGGIDDPVYGVDTVPTMVTLSALKRRPRSNADIDRRVTQIAREHVGAGLAPVLVSAWRDVDHALRLWPNNADTNHMLYPKYSIIGDRWLVRPLVPVPELLTEDEKAYYSKHRHLGRQLAPEEVDSFFMAESVKNYETPEFKWLVAIYDEMIDYMNRAVGDMEAALSRAPDETMEKRFRLQYHRIAAARAVWRTQRNVLRCGSIIEFFTGAKKDEYWHVIRRDESFLEPATYRRLFLEGVDDEIENCRDMIRMMAESEVPLFSTGEEQSFVLPENLSEQLEKKIAVMEARKTDIDRLFPNCPPETFTDPTYEWADRTTDEEEP